MISDLFKEHFLHPQNAYYIPDPDGAGSSGDPECGDSVSVFIKIQSNIIQEISYLVFGCSGAIAVSSMTSMLAKGKTLTEALSITEQEVVDAFHGFPAEKTHCSVLAIDALHKAIHSYMQSERAPDPR